MNAFYKLACALVAWSALSVAGGSDAASSLSALPSSAFDMAADNPDRFSYLRPGIDLHQYHGVLLAPLTFIAEADGDWSLQRALPDNPLDQHFRQTITQALQTLGIPVVQTAGEEVLRLRLALGHDPRRSAVEPALDLNQWHDGAAHYLAQIQVAGQVEDSQSGLLLAGSAELGPHAQGRDVMLGRVEHWGRASANRLANALGRC